MPTNHTDYICQDTPRYINCTNRCVNTGGYTNCTNYCSEHVDYTNSTSYSCVDQTSYSNVTSYYCSNKVLYDNSTNYSCYDTVCYNCGNTGCPEISGCCTQDYPNVSHNNYVNSTSYSCTDKTTYSNITSYYCSNTVLYDDSTNYSCTDSSQYTNCTNTCSQYNNYSNCTNSCTNYGDYNDYSNTFTTCTQGVFKHYNRQINSATYTEYVDGTATSCAEGYNGNYTGYTNVTNIPVNTGGTGQKWGRPINSNLSSWGAPESSSIDDSTFGILKSRIENELNSITRDPSSVTISPISSFSEQGKITKTEFDELKNNLASVSQQIKFNKPAGLDPAIPRDVGSISPGQIVDEQDLAIIKDEIQQLAEQNLYRDYFDCGDNTLFE